MITAAFAERVRAGLLLRALFVPSRSVDEIDELERRQADVGAALRAVDWVKLRAQVLRFAFYRSKNRALAEDLTQEALRRVADPLGSPWDPAKEPQVARACMSVVNSLLANERTSARARRDVALDHGRERTVDRDALSEERVADDDLYEKRLAALRARLANDAVALDVLARMIDGVEAPAALKDATKLSYEAIVAARLRIRRNAKVVARELGGEHERENAGAEDESEVA